MPDHCTPLGDDNPDNSQTHIPHGCLILQPDRDVPLCYLVRRVWFNRMVDYDRQARMLLAEFHLTCRVRA
jgi:hypothetical protein